MKKYKKPFFINYNDSLEKNLFYAFFLFSELFCVIATICSFLEQFSISLNIGCIICSCIPPIVFFLCYRSKAYSLGHFFMTLCINALMIPTAYFLSGGIHSGVPIIFFAGQICCATCSESSHRVISYIVAVICHGICIALEITNPQLIPVLDSASLKMDIIISLFITSVVIYYYFSIILETHEIDANIRINELNRRNALYQNMLEQQNENIEETKRARHDVRHHNLVLLEYLESNHPEKALEYLREKMKRDEFYEKKIYCMNSILDSIFNYANRRCNKNNILFDVEADVTNKLPIKENDLTSIFANVVENAINGAIESNEDKKELHIKTFCKSEKLIFICSNTCSSALVLYKGFPKNKSTGIQSIIDSVNDYDGTINYELSDNIVTCTIILNYKNNN